MKNISENNLYELSNRSRFQRLMSSQLLVVFAFFLIVLNLPGLVYAESLSSDPMETKVQAAPANIMFILDNSGSMDFEFMSPEDEGIFHSEYYLYNISDNAYSDSYLLTGSKLLEWKSQWFGYNKIYYNPASTYHPWPRWEKMPNTKAANGTKIGSGGTSPPHEADIKEPRSNPIDNTPTFNLFATFYNNVPVNTYVIVDNNDSSPAFVSTGTWYESSLTPEWNGTSQYSGTDGDTAVFMPDIPETGQYNIFAWWNCATTRDQNALIQVDADGDGNADDIERRDQHSTSNDTPEADVCGEWLPLFGGDDFLFSNGQHGTVTITRDAPINGTTVADAIAFVVAGATMVDSTVDISNVHYYMVNDVNGDGEADPGEVYLVNFIWNDADYDTVIDEGEINRDYYRVSFSSSTTHHEVVQSFFPVDSDASDQGHDSVPDSLQPKWTNEAGVEIFLTDMEDLQNYSNWFSFYRRRELTAKAAVGRTIDGLEWVNVGYYTLHSSGGARQTVLPIKVGAGNEVIVDNYDSGFTKSNSWSESGSTPEYDASSLYTSIVDKWARWTPNISSTGDYEVFARWNCFTDRDQKAKFTISHSGSTTVKELNQRASSQNTVTMKTDCGNSSGSGCCGDWVSLGSYTFTEGNAGYVQVERHGSSTGNSTTADAVKFVGSGSVDQDDTDTLLDVLYSIDSYSGTPLREALRDVGRYFDQDDGFNGHLGASPYVSEADGGSCQQAFAIAMTDGYWNGDPPSVGHQDSGEEAPYGDNFPDTLADVAWKYYDDDLADDLPDEMSTNNYDKSKTQHMVTYSVSFGLGGSIDLTDIDNDGSTDDPGYAADPYFLNPNTPTPTWPNPASCSSCPKKIDDLVHASVNGRGRFFQADDPDSLVASLKELFKDISSRTASGASVSVNGDELSTGLILYQSSYESGAWTGDVAAYPIDPSTGEIKKGDDDILWQAKDKLQDQHWSSGRRIITSKSDDNTGVAFRYENLTTTQKNCLNDDSDVVDYLRGEEIEGFRSRTRKLGDIVHSAPLLVGSTIYTGGNDGMLHAFNADTGEERFAYVPLHSFTYLYDLTKNDYNHHFYVDATPFAKGLVFLNNDGTYDETVTVLVGALKKGGRGIYALDISAADGIGSSTSETSLADMVMWEYPPAPAGMTFEFAGDQTGDGIDNDGDGDIDESDENYGDGHDNDGDGNTDEVGEKWFDFGDPDMGYSFSDPQIVRSYKSLDETQQANHPWIVVFGNGYESENGHAVLYIVDALSGALIKKIDTGSGSNNGLSVPTIVDVDNDDRADYVYAGDLLGNIWKFDLTDYNPANWSVAYEAGGAPQPLFTVPGQPITSALDVAYHCDKDGYLVAFGTGKFLGEDDRSDINQQSIFGIWDFSNKIPATSDSRDNDHDGDIDEVGEEKLDPAAYLGTWSRTTNTVTHLSGVKLLEQTEIDWRFYGDSYLRTLSDHRPQWYLDGDGIPESPSAYSGDSIDNDLDGEIDETGENIGHVGWFFDLPYNAKSDGVDNDNDGTTDEDDEEALLGERVIKDVLIRDGRVIVISFIPEDSPCTGGGFSIVHEIDVCDGSRLDQATFDINNDGLIDDNDLIDIGLVDDDGNTILVAPSGKKFEGILHSPVIVKDRDPKTKRELKIFSSSAGTTEIIWERQEKVGLYYWLEH